MSLPGFTAEVSLYRTSNQYQQATAGRTGTAFITLSTTVGGIFSGFGCYGRCFKQYSECSGGPLTSGECGMILRLCLDLVCQPIFSQ
jgi:hypothetical protein